MILIKKVALLVLLLWTSNSAPVSVINFNLFELYDRSDVVAVVEMRSGSLKKLEGKECGATYKARVVQSLKGGKEGNTISISPYIGLRIGIRYLVFLVDIQGPQMSDHAMNIDVCDSLQEGKHTPLSRGEAMFEVSPATGAVAVPRTKLVSMESLLNIPDSRHNEEITNLHIDEIVELFAKWPSATRIKEREKGRNNE